MDYESLLFVIEDIENARKNIEEYDSATKRI